MIYTLTNGYGEILFQKDQTLTSVIRGEVFL
jgi:hypothetical protein